ncbi:DUF3667 domain-containing protein [Massilibacteroides sp.]|uniref:DUF3667 domain-containing protein n=1 Tax=Massilibacteroides sp. TaxID=2034766 RepID=UPI002608885E|nr:DUF3667 domain-containing protein [Massilibacteroides sp.]MDD4514802.1 DUF3667 domain-containing protein [Massilibacteroides sp.]
MKCKNCNSEVNTPYCPYCGQESDTSSLTYKSLAQSVMLSFGTVDRGMIRTLIDLFVRPARMSIEYIHGRRVTFFAPFQLLFIMATAYMIIYFWSGENSDFTFNDDIKDLLSPALNTFATKLIRFFQNNRGIMWVCCIPLQVFVFRMLYKEVRYRFTWVETCFIAAYFFSQIIIVELLAVLYNLVFSSYSISDNTLMFTYLLLLSYDMKQLTGGTWKKNIFKCIYSQLLFYILLGILAIVAIGIAIAFYEAIVIPEDIFE